MKKLLLLLFLSLSGFAQTLDPTFNSAHNGPYEEYIGDGGMFTDDGKLLTHVGYTIKRYNNDGSIDNAFATVNNVLFSFFFKGSNGKFGAYYFNANAQTFYFFNQDGSPITGFVQPTFSADAAIYDLIWQADGKIVIVGVFTSINGYSYNNMARLNANGSVDTTFNAGTGPNASTFCVAQQPDGKYVVGGDFNYFNGAMKWHLVRLNSNGSVDSTFYDYASSTYCPNSGVRTVAIQSDGKIILGGSDFVNGSSVVTRSLIRLLANGTRDTSFICTLTDVNAFQEFLIMLNGKYLLYDQLNHKLYRLNSTGTVDSSWGHTNENVSLNLGMHSMQNLPDNKIFINSNYKSAIGITRRGMYRLNQDGSLDFTFNPQQSTNAVCGTLKVLDNNKIIAVGQFTAYNDTPSSRMICRLSENGELDPTFTIDSQVIIGAKSIIKEQDDNKILVANNYDESSSNTLFVNSVAKQIIRINENGSLDTSFNMDNSNIYIIYDFEILNDGKILVSAGFQGGTKKIARYNSDGSVDSGFTQVGLSDASTRFTKFSDGSLFKIGVVISDTTPVVKKLNADGTLDTTFNCTLTNVLGIDRQSEGKYLVSYYGSGQRKVSRVNSNGAVDATFTMITKTAGSNGYNQLFINSENKIFIFRLFGYTSTVVNTVDIYNSNGVFEQSVSGNFDEQMVKQGCDNLLMSPGNNSISSVSSYDIRRYTIFTGTITPPPTGASPQPFVSDYTLANLIVSGANVTWYNSQSQCGLNIIERSSQTLDLTLPLTTPLVNGTTYYASQTIGGIESSYRLPIKVTSTLSLADIDYNSFTINNPVSDYLQLHSNFTFHKVELYSVNGVKLMDTNFPNNYDGEIRIEKFSKGFYIVKIYTDRGIFSKKVIKE